MKPRLQVSLGQHLVMTPQLQQAIRLLQLSALELETELKTAIESNPLLDWADGNDETATDGEVVPPNSDDVAPVEEHSPHEVEEFWARSERDIGYERAAPGDSDDDTPLAEQVAESETLHDHLLWQLHLSHLSPRDRIIGVTLIEAIGDDGYLREPFNEIADSLGSELHAGEDEILTVLHQIQRFDPVGVGARDLGECLRLQLQLLPCETPGLQLARLLTEGPMERLPRVGVTGLANELKRPVAEVDVAVQLLRSLDPRPGSQVGAMTHDTYVMPDVVIWRQHGVWRVALSAGTRPRVGIHRAYENMIRHASASDASYLRGHLQEARWLLKSLEARGETLLKVARCLLQQQAGFLEFGDRALRPLTLREVAAEVGLHESTISRAIARKYARTPRGTIPLRAFFASGIDTGTGGETSSTAIQSMIRRLIEAENPRKPLSDARLAETLKATGVPVARRTVAKYREAMSIPSSQDRMRIV